MEANAKKDLFYALEEHLLSDAKPSTWVTAASAEPPFAQEPFAMLLRLKRTKQSPVHHREGSAWNHTMLVVDWAAKLKGQSKDPRALMWAALLHDVGKPETTRVRNGRITSYNHEKVGAAMARRFLSAFTDDQTLIGRVEALVRWHMEILFVVKGLPHGDAKAMLRQADVQEVALLGFADRMGREGADEALEKENIDRFLQLCGRAAKKQSG